MAQTTTIARPYAKAVFELAREARDFAGWQAQLELLAHIAADPGVRVAIGNPKVETKDIAALVLGVAGDKLSPVGRNLVAMLAERKRLVVMGEVLEQFVALRREAEKTVEVELVTATPADAATQQRFAAALEKKLGRKVELKNRTDAGLIGGALIKAGDLAIDGSVRGRLERLATQLAK
jgi:F-type H+-transporting ATPase subunit delta